MNEQGELYAGRMMGQYELLTPLAQGATAEVWAARITGSALEKIVAIKAMLTELSSDVEAESMFLDEARLASRIRHPNVATVLELGELDDALYIVMEWIEGEPLQIVMREAKGQGLPLPLAVRIVQQAAGGLHAAHELRDEMGNPTGLVHRDVSPQNILIGYDGAVKVIDFGVAKAAFNLQKTSVGQVKGKVPYMAPEQAAGERVDRRADIFALGVVLYQLVTGKHPFRGENEFVTLARIRDPKPAASPLTLVPNLPAPLVEVMLRALAKNRDQRFGTMLELSRALDQAVASGPDVDRALGQFIGSLLMQRAKKRTVAIRDTLRQLHGDGCPMPVNLAMKALASETGAFQRPEPQALASASMQAAAQAPAAPQHAVTVGAAGAAPVAGVAIAAGPDMYEFPGARDRRRRNMIAAGIAIFVVLVLAIWAVAGGSSDSSGDTTTRHAF